MNREIDRRSLLAAVPATAGSALFQQTSGKKRTLMCVGAHMDDNEAACGLMLKAVKAGLRVVAVQTVGDWSNWPPAKGKEAAVKEGVLRIARDMGIEKILLGYKYHYVPVDDEIKTRIAQIMAEIEPEIAVIIHEHDYWTDHANTGRAAKDGIMFAHGYLAREVKSPRAILTYATGNNQTYDFHPDTFVDTSDVVEGVANVINQLDGLLSDGPKYVSSLTIYKNGRQSTKLDLTTHADRMLATAKYWGDRCGARYAEAFQSIRFTTRDLW